MNAVIQGWMNYYGEFYKTALYPLLRRINGYLMRWLRKKYRRLRTLKKAHAGRRRTNPQYTPLFPQWRGGPGVWRAGGERPGAAGVDPPARRGPGGGAHPGRPD